MIWKVGCNGMVAFQNKCIGFLFTAFGSNGFENLFGIIKHRLNLFQYCFLLPEGHCPRLFDKSSDSENNHSHCSTFAFHVTLIVQTRFQVLPESLFQPSVL